MAVNPIIDWTDDDVWGYIKDQKITLNPLYGCGYARVGCIGCPMAGKSRTKEFARYPTYKTAYILAFDKMLTARKQRGLKTDKWLNGIDVFHWWMEDGVLSGQIDFEDLET